MKKIRYFVGLAAILCQAPRVTAAPLFPDVRDDHWAKDAVSALVAKGLLEGYPDGTFKGDRAASRWEVAMIVARLLAKMEQAHATFATKAEMDELRKLANSLQDELAALGVRVNQLEGSVGLLDKRVTELERITFYGEVTTKVVAQTFRNTGIPAMVGTAPSTKVNTIDYNQAVGSSLGGGGFIAAPSPAAGLPNNYFVTGTAGVTDWLTGRPLVNGAGFTSLGILGVNVKVNQDIDAGIEFAAFSSQGNSVVNAFWGVSAPYQSNPFTSITTTGTGPAAAGLGSDNHTPWTRMTLDHFWVTYKPTNTTVVLGSFGGTDYDPIVYSPEPNPTAGGTPYLNDYGFKVKGDVKLGESKGSPLLTYELIGTILADGNVDMLTGNSTSYFDHAEGGNLAFKFDEGKGVARFNFLHAANDASGGASLAVGLIQLPNLVANWVNPNGYYWSQQGGPNSRVAGVGTTSDIRPVVMGASTDGITGKAGTFNTGGIGPQDQTMYGGSFHYNFDCDYKPRFLVEYGHSDYKPQKNSTYGVGGNAFRVKAGASFFDNKLDVDVAYLRVDPTYDPFVLQFPMVGGIYNTLWRIADLNQLWNTYSLHDTAAFPQNREGVRAEAIWHFNPHGSLSLSYGHLEQTQSSLQDIRYGAGSLGANTPNTSVLGFSPGFTEPLFLGLSRATFASSGGNSLAVPLENNKGTLDHYSISASQKFVTDEAEDRGVTVCGTFLNYNWRRDSNMVSILGGPDGYKAENENYVNFTTRGLILNTSYDVTRDFHVKAGFTQVDVFGHIDPGGVYTEYAQANKTTRFNTWDITQRIPEIGFNWELSDKTSWSLGAKYYFESDHMPSSITPSPGLPSLNVSVGPQTAHPFNFEGLQVMSTFSVKF